MAEVLPVLRSLLPSEVEVTELLLRAGGEAGLQVMVDEAVTAAAPAEAEADAHIRSLRGKADVGEERLVRDYVWIVQDQHGARDNCPF